MHYWSSLKAILNRTALGKEVLNVEYEYVIATHVDRNHIHNHVIFNNVNWKTGKCYQSNKRSYHRIKYQSDKLCKENNLMVIEEYHEKYKKNIILGGNPIGNIKNIKKELHGKVGSTLI